jgi:transaldolase
MRPTYGRLSRVRYLNHFRYGSSHSSEWASTGTKDATASELLYVRALAAPFTVNTMPEVTLNALANRKELGSILPADGGDCEEVLSLLQTGIDIKSLAGQLQEEGARLFVNSWDELMSMTNSIGLPLAQAASLPEKHGDVTRSSSP